MSHDKLTVNQQLAPGCSRARAKLNLDQLDYNLVHDFSHTKDVIEHDTLASRSNKAYPVKVKKYWKGVLVDSHEISAQEVWENKELQISDTQVQLQSSLNKLRM